MVQSKPHVYVIAEAGVNHNGSLDLARQLIDAAVESGADAVKFQTFKAAGIVTRSASKADYQSEQTDAAESQIQMLQRLELSDEAHAELIPYAASKGIQFLSTAFDFDSLKLLANRFDLPRLKIPSGEMTNAPLILQHARTGKPLIVSTGICTIDEIQTVLGVIAFGYLNLDHPSLDAFQAAFESSEGQTLLKERVTLLHCTTEYPTPYSEINLKAMDAIQDAFGLEVGLSDHSQGINMAIAAAARGATMIEKHFTLSRELPGPDHQASLEPQELQAMVIGIRQVEEALGRQAKEPTASELKNRDIVRKSLVAACRIKTGEVFTAENLAIKRPGTGISPLAYWSVIGNVADRDYSEDELIQEV